jgi:hypothetical protein
MDDRRIPHLALATLLALTASMSACTSAHPTGATVPSTTVGPTNAVRAEPPVPPVPPADKRLVETALAQWRSLTAGHTVTYTASSECIVCTAPGRWTVVERDGALVSATPLDGQDPSNASLVPTVTQVLLAAVAAKGNATASVSPTHVFVTFDADPQISGDEGDITAENIVLS